ncbi:MAG: NAD(P)/FAD-dependent oxidoreductase, partial [Microcystaceae cyanobacterium]
VVNLGFTQLTGLLAWMIWVWAHIYYLIEFDNKLIVMLQWGWNYFAKGRGARIITGEAQVLSKDQPAQSPAYELVKN